MHRPPHPAKRAILTTAALGLLFCSARAQSPADFESTEPAIQPSLTATGEFWHNASGGLATGSRWNSLVDLSLEVDVAALGGPAGAALVAQLFWIENQHATADFTSLTGTANPVSGIHATDSWRVFNLFYRQAWGDNRYVLKLGQLALDDDFMGSEFASLFALSALGAMPSQVATPHCGRLGGGGAFPVYAVAAPGAFFCIHPTEDFAFQLGIYHGGPGRDDRANHGFEWADGSGQGAVVFYEGAYRFLFAGKRSTLRLGGGVHTGRFDNFAALATAADLAEVHGLHTFYMVHDVVLAERDEEGPLLGAFWRAGVCPQQDRSVVHRYVDAGLNWFAPLPGRKDDIAGVALSYTEYGDGFRRVDPARASAETALELTYRAQVTTHLALQAVAQRHFDPLADVSGRRRAATVFGLRAELAF